MANCRIWREATQAKCPSPEDTTRAFRTLSPSDAPHQSECSPQRTINVFTCGCWFLMCPCQAPILWTAPAFCPSRPSPGWHPWCGAYSGTRRTNPASDCLLTMALRAHLKGQLFCWSLLHQDSVLPTSPQPSSCSAGFRDSGRRKWPRWAWRRPPWFELSFASKEPGWFSPSSSAL